MPLINKLPFIGRRLGNTIDERFLMHRLRSSSFASITGACLLGGLFEYDLIAHHVYRWDLFAILGAMATVKLSAMAWFHYTD